MMPRFTSAQKHFLQALAWVVLYLAVAHCIGEMTRAQIPHWYRALTKPPLNPPDFVFPVAWITLYIMIGIAASRVWRERKTIETKVLTLFVAQTFLNWGWSYAFFKFHLLGFSFAWILGLDIIVAWLILSLFKKDRLSAALLLPYLCWLLFATYLNGMIWVLNERIIS